MGSASTGGHVTVRLGLPAGQKLFSCHVCSNTFSTKGSLKVHMRLHTGAKPFKCPHCELRFRTSGRRKTHMQFHYKADPKKARKPVPRSPPDALPPAGLLSPSPADPSVFVMNSSVLTGQFDPSLLQQGLVSQAVLPASMSGERRVASGQGRAPREPALLCRCSVTRGGMQAQSTVTCCSKCWLSSVISASLALMCSKHMGLFPDE